MKRQKRATADIGKEALAQHKKLGGKLSVEPKAALRTKRDLSLYYTPGVGTVSAYVAKHRKQTRDYTIKQNTVAVVSDGSAVLGLGNIGPEGALPVMEGKAMIFKEFAGIDAFPLVLATQDTEEIIKTVTHIAPAFGGVNLEDFSAPRCFEIEERLKKELSIPIMHDDQHGTAIVVLAGLINACKVTRRQLKKARVVIVGAGAAGYAVAMLLKRYGVGDIIVTDSRGIISKKRNDLNEYKKRLVPLTARDVSGDLGEAMADADVVVGVSGPDKISERHVARMAKEPIVFALANPVPEIMPDGARRAGAAVVATGRSDFPNQVNNALVFPGVFRGALDNGVRAITDAMKVKAAENLAALVVKPASRNILPAIFDKRVVPAIARAIR